MKTKHIILASLFALCTLTLLDSCKKYEDGPAISLRTKKARISGEWKIESVTLNGNDVTSTYQTLLGANFMFEIEKDGTYKRVGNFSDNGTWKFGEDKDDVYFTSSASGSSEVANRILRLANSELWLRYTASNGDVTITKYKH